MEKGKHLDLTARIDIELGLKDGKSFKEIGRIIKKDNTTVSKEVKRHLVFEKTGCYGHRFNNCIHRNECKTSDICKSCIYPRYNNRCRFCGECIKHCRDYEREECQKLKKPPYVCNGCKERNACRLEKVVYRAALAYREYVDDRRESRSGIGLSREEIKEIDTIITPLLKNGQSIHHICVNNRAKVPVCEKTLYKYADAGLFEARNIDMPRKVAFKPRKKKSTELKVDKKCRIGRTLEDYESFMREHPSLHVTQADSVEGTKGGAVLLTLHFLPSKVQLAFKREHNDAASVTEIINSLYETLGKEDYARLMTVIVADNGTEFSDPLSIELDKDGNRRSYVFYCDPSSPYQKGACENNHEFIRRIIPKGIDISKYSDEQISLMMDHINSYGRPELADKAPYEMMEFLYGKDVPAKLGTKMIPKNDVILKPSLLISKTVNTQS